MQSGSRKVAEFTRLFSIRSIFRVSSEAMEACEGNSNKVVFVAEVSALST